jgi:hypothetical protein
MDSIEIFKRMSLIKSLLIHSNINEEGLIEKNTILKHFKAHNIVSTSFNNNIFDKLIKKIEANDNEEIMISNFINVYSGRIEKLFSHLNDLYNKSLKCKQKFVLFSNKCEELLGQQNAIHNISLEILINDLRICDEALNNLRIKTIYEDNIIDSLKVNEKYTM